MHRGGNGCPQGEGAVNFDVQKVLSSLILVLLASALFMYCVRGEGSGE